MKIKFDKINDIFLVGSILITIIFNIRIYVVAQNIEISILFTIFSLLMICAFCFAGCTNSSECYVQGLINLNSQENNKAIKNFEKEF